MQERFVRRAKRETKPILDNEIAKASKEVTDVFKAELEKIRNRKRNGKLNERKGKRL